MDPSISFHKHCNYVSERIDKRNNMLKALAGSSWGQDTETLLLTYNALGKSIASYAAPVWSTNASDSSFKKIQTAQNAGLMRTATGAYKMSSIDHLHQESLTLRFKDHSYRLSAQYLVNCLETHSLFIHIPASIRLKSRKDFLTNVKPSYFPPKVIRCSEWQRRTRDKSRLGMVDRGL